MAYGTIKADGIQDSNGNTLDVAAVVTSEATSLQVDGKHSIGSIVETSTGSNLILNNSFQSGNATSWDAGNGNASVMFWLMNDEGQLISGGILGTAQSANAYVFSQSFTTVAGTIYNVSSTMGGDGVTRVHDGSGTGGTLLTTLTSASTADLNPMVEVTGTFTATSTTTTISLFIEDQDTMVQFKDIVVGEQISSDVLTLKNITSSDTYATFAEEGSCTLYHDNSPRLKTTANGLNLAGLPVYADNQAATNGGLEVNDLYRTSYGELRIKV